MFESGLHRIYQDVGPFGVALLSGLYPVRSL